MAMVYRAILNDITGTVEYLTYVDNALEEHILMKRLWILEAQQRGVDARGGIKARFYEGASSPGAPGARGVVAAQSHRLRFWDGGAVLRYDVTVGDLGEAGGWIGQFQLIRKNDGAGTWTWTIT